MLPGVVIIKIFENDLWIVVKIVGSYNLTKNLTPEKVLFKYFAWNPEHLLTILYLNSCRNEEYSLKNIFPSTLVSIILTSFQPTGQVSI